MDSDSPSVDIKDPKKNSGFEFEDFLYNYRKSLTTILGGLILIGIGFIIFKTSGFNQSSKVEILKSNSPSLKGRTLEAYNELVVEISGAVQAPGVYKLKEGSRIDDLLISAGGVSAEADRIWVNKYINRAAKLTDGQKLYIPQKGESDASIKSMTSDGEIVAGVNVSGLININEASQKELESLPGIGPVYAQSIIEGRMYSSVEELLSKGKLKKSTYDKIKDRVSVN